MLLDLFSEYSGYFFSALLVGAAFLPIELRIRHAPTVLSLRIWRLWDFVLFDSAKPRKKKKKKAKTPSPKKQETKTPKAKIALRDYYRLLTEPTALKIAKDGLRGTVGFFRVFKLNKLEWEIGLKDYARQGMLEAVIALLPRKKRFCVSGNFEEKNRFEMRIGSSPALILSGGIRLLWSLPWKEIFRLFRKYGQLRKKALDEGKSH